jgi:phosphohistidine swiveling domain-containing protein
MSVQKEKYMEMTRKPTKNKILKCYDQEYERVKKFKYLGTVVTEDNYLTTGVE